MPELIGSGILIRLGRDVFLVSAAHVADRIVRGPHYFGTRELIPLPSLKLSSPLPASRNRDDDPIDLAYWVIDPATLKRIAIEDCLAVDELDAVPVSDVPHGDTHFLSGYPCTRQPRHIDGKELDAETLSFLTDEVTPEEYGALGRDRTTSIVVDYDKEDFYRYGEKLTGPDLHGVSGGAIWRLHGPACHPQRPLLTGFATTWRKAPPRAVVGTRVHVWLRHVAAKYPNVRTALLAELKRRRTA